MKRNHKISVEELRAVHSRIKERENKHRQRYKEIHGKTVDFVEHWMEENILFVSIRFPGEITWALPESQSPKSGS